jgi:thiopeptide-type bacteriocin biosynthesis protein
LRPCPGTAGTGYRYVGVDGRHHNLEPSGFFVLRTPLLPFDELQSWSNTPRAPEALAHPEAPSAARRLLIHRLRALWQDRPDIREAVFLASPELDAALQRTTDNDAAIRGLLAYFTRMASRATPFGLFAGCSVGTPGQRTRLDLPPRASYHRHTRLDMDFLSALVGALDSDPVVRQTLRYFPNSSLYSVGGRLHYAESRLDQTGRAYHLVALEATPELTTTLERAGGGACLDDVAAALVDDDVSPAEARQFVDELIDSQVLVSDLGPDVTGPEAIHGLIARFAERAQFRSVASCLEHVRDGLERIDAAGVGGNLTERYAEVSLELEPLPARPNPARLFQVDMFKPTEGLSLGPLVMAEIARGVSILHRLADTDERHSPLRVFKERFAARYEEAEIPLVEALDEEIGIGFAGQREPGGEPLLLGLDVPPPQPDARAWTARDDLRLSWLVDAVRTGKPEIDLGPADVEALGSPPTHPLPDAMAVFARLAAASAEAVDRGQFRIYLQGASGPSGAQLLGRFCHADPNLHHHLQDHLRAEEALRPNAVFAEIVHLPEGRLGNILSRPVLREYEIPFMGQSGAACDRQIPVTDLRVAVRGGRVVLRSARLNLEVLPRLSTAHNFTLRSLGVYRFLCALQHEGRTWSLGWEWGPLERAPYLPRVVSGRLVLSRAAWNVPASELKPLLDMRGDAQFAGVHVWRQTRGLPRHIALADADNELVIDLDNVLSVDAFLHLARGRETAHLVELFPPPEELCVVGPEGRFVNELIVPFVRPVTPVAVPSRRFETQHTIEQVPRRFTPGSAWLYLKLYTGPTVADRILVETLRPAIDAALDSGCADGWFFIRYADPDFHLRLRFHGDPGRLSSELLPDLTYRLAPLVENGRIARWQIDTYVREVERYGGAEAILLAEQFFGLDSECVLAILESVPGDEGLVWRWKLALCGVDLLLDALGFDLTQKTNWARERRDAFAGEFRPDHRLRQQLGDKYRAERHALEDLWRLAHSTEAAQYPALDALRRRAEAMAPLVQKVDQLRRDGRLEIPLSDLAASYAHMHVNRLLRSEQRLQELAIYELLDRIYRSQLARAASP